VTIERRDGWYEYEKVKVSTWDCEVEDHMMIDYAKTFFKPTLISYPWI
jgi:hypothetical protein